MRTILGQRPAYKGRAFLEPIDPDGVSRGGEYTVAVGFTAVAVVTKGIDWAAYYGLDTRLNEDIASHGDKLPEAAARALFPGVEERYRL